ncbi:MAG: adenylate kinase [Candidatus Aenigmarchaeota archaeon]|nr:adenylate kinase [Candidatus Aenigmarchaeota archaeon]
MRLLIFGPPGCGKGTQSHNIAKTYKIVEIATGDIFETEMLRKTDLGRKIENIMKKGFLVSDDITNALVEKRLSQPDCRRGFIIDGYPRNVNQALYLERILDKLNEAIDAVIYLDILKDKLIERITNRRTCSNCQTTFNLLYNPPKNDNICDECGGELYISDLDKPEVTKTRLEIYATQTYPAFEYWRNKVTPIIVNADQKIGKVFEDIKQELKKIK